MTTLEITFMLSTIVSVVIAVIQTIKANELERIVDVEPIRNGLYTSMMLNALEDSSYTDYWPKECREINEADKLYLDGKKLQLVCDLANGLNGYLIGEITEGDNNAVILSVVKRKKD